MRRRVARPFGRTVAPTRIVSLLFAVVLLFVFYDRAKDPDTWRWLTGEKAAADEIAPVGPNAPDWAKIDANVVPGSNDRDPAEKAAVAQLLDRVGDKVPLRGQEMAAYWKLMDWAQAEPFRDLEKRARGEVPFIQLWEQPGRYRGELIRLRLHVTRVLDFENPSAGRNGDGPRRVYEAWGWTDDSKSLPYAVVFPDLPEGLPTGDGISGEIVFVGYFLKLMAYEASDDDRAAPLLAGRARLAAAPSSSAKSTARESEFTTPVIALLGVGAAAIVGLGLWSVLRGRPQGTRGDAADYPPDVNIDLGTPGPAHEFRFDLSPPSERGILPPAPPRPDEPS